MRLYRLWCHNLIKSCVVGLRSGEMSWPLLLSLSLSLTGSKKQCVCFSVTSRFFLQPKLPSPVTPVRKLTYKVTHTRCQTYLPSESGLSIQQWSIVFLELFFFSVLFFFVVVVIVCVFKGLTHYIIKFFFFFFKSGRLQVQLAMAIFFWTTAVIIVQLVIIGTYNCWQTSMENCKDLDFVWYCYNQMTKGLSCLIL